MNTFYKDLAITSIIIAATIALLVIPPIQQTNKLIAGDDVASYYGLPKPYIIDGE